MDKIKIIIDTDIGSDIDDTWALVLALTDPKFDIRLISVTEGGVEHKALLVAKILTEMGRTDIPIAIGEEHGEIIDPQAAYLGNFSFEEYRGSIRRDYVEAYREILTNNKDVIVVALAPTSTLGKIAHLLVESTCPVVAMAGAVRAGYFGAKEPVPECNVVSNLETSKMLFESGISYTMLPLDVCNDIRIFGEKYQRILRSESVAAKVIKKNYRAWDEVYTGGSKKYGYERSSTILYDLAPFWYLKFPNCFNTENLLIHIDEYGVTREGSGVPMRVATLVKDLDYLIDDAVKLLTR